MKKIKFLLLSSLLLTFTFSVFGASTETNSVVTTVTTKETFNSVMVDILSGVKTASGEIYGATKGAIRTSVDFVAKETPEVITQFIKWHLLRACIWAAGFLGLGGFLLYLSRRCRIFHEKDIHNENDGLFIVGRIMTILAAIPILFFGAGGEIMTITKITVAPKVYIIEYVVDTVQGGHQKAGTR